MPYYNITQYYTILSYVILCYAGAGWDAEADARGHGGVRPVAGYMYMYIYIYI